MSAPPPPAAFDADLLALLACPRCKSKLRLDAEGAHLVCEGDAAGCPRSFPIENGIPNLLL